MKDLMLCAMGATDTKAPRRGDQAGYIGAMRDSNKILRLTTLKACCVPGTESRGNIKNNEERRGIKIEVNSNKNKKNKFNNLCTF